jgi:hypothetical protein
MENRDIDDENVGEMEVDEPENQIDNELLNEKLENIMKKFENLDVENEIGEKEKNRDCRLIIEKIELENFKSYAGLRTIGPLHYVNYINISVLMQLLVLMEAGNQI